MLTKDEKSKVIKQHKISEKDTGSHEVQIAILTKRIDQLIEHLKTHKKDNHSRRGLLKMVSKRRKFLEYVKTRKPTHHKKLVKNLKLKG